MTASAFPPVRTAVFPVGGLGTRFLPATKAMPKEMLPVVDKPLIQYAFEEAKNAGIERFLFVTGRNKNVLANHFDHAYELQKTLSEKDKKHELALTTEWQPPAGRIAFIRQQEPLGLGHAVWCARHFVGNEPFAVLLADELLMSDAPGIGQLMDVYNRTGGSVLGIGEVPKDETDKYGIITPGSDDGRVCEVRGMVEKPKPKDAPSQLAIVGRYVLHPSIFPLLSEGKRGAGGEVQLTDAMATQMTSGHAYHGIRLAGQRFDCGGKVGFLEANVAFALSREDMAGRVRPMLQRLLSA